MCVDVVFSRKNAFYIVGAYEAENGKNMLDSTKGISSAQWNKIESLLDKALELPVGARTAFLREASEEDAALKTLLMGLWDAGKEATAFLEGDIPAEVVQAIDQISIEEAYGPAPTQGMRFGEYQVIEEIGRGGMSIVYKAQRADGQFEQTVAMKILKRGMDTDLVVQRFLAERQILAGLQHANIARLLDGGATPDGRPYLIMEHVEGVSLTKYCDQAKLDISSRLALFRRVCEAVEFAHRNLIVHRDLKPSNILVTEDGEVKLLDFGIAKVISTEEEEQMLTVAGGRVMTPEYAAPEQIFGETITTATDVYALGVLLYELLCGQLPLRYDVRTLRGIERAMREHEAPLISEQIDLDNADAAEARGLTIHKLRQHLQGDLDLIVQKALRKETARRYQSVSELIDELDRYEDGRPVKVRPDSWGYRASKFYGRYRTTVLAGGIALLLLISSFLGTLWQAKIASDERDVARQEAEKSAQVTNFLVDVFESIDPDVAKGDTLTAYEILDRGAARLEALDSEPEVQAEMMTVIGRMYQRLAEFERAEDWLYRALQLRMEHDISNRDLVQNEFYYTAALLDQGKIGQTDSMLQIIADRDLDLSIAENVSLNTRIQELKSIVLMEQGAFNEADSILNFAVAKQVAILGEDNPEIASHFITLGDISNHLSQFDRAESYFQKAIKLYRAYPEGREDELSEALFFQTISLRNRGRMEEAELLCKESYEIRKRLFGEDHPLVVEAMGELGVIYSETGRSDEALAIKLDVLEKTERIFGERHHSTLEIISNVATEYIFRKEFEEARVHAARALSLRREMFGSKHPFVAKHLGDLGLIEAAMGNYEEAEQLHKKSLALALEMFPENHFGIGLAKRNVGNVIAAQNRSAEALLLFNESLQILQASVDPGHQFIAEVFESRAKVYQALGQIDKAEEDAMRALEMSRNNFGVGHENTHQLEQFLSNLFEESGRPELAAKVLRRQ